MPITSVLERELGTTQRRHCECVCQPPRHADQILDDRTFVDFESLNVRNELVALFPFVHDAPHRLECLRTIHISG